MNEHSKDHPAGGSASGLRRSAPALGRGLSALMGSAAPAYRPTGQNGDDDVGFKQIPIHAIHANPNQPRKHFEKGAIDGLADSIREMGILQPILVRPDESRPGNYELIAGERRWQAAQQAGLSDIPCIVQAVENSEVAERALTENIQRENLNPLEEANALFFLIDSFGLGQETVARKIGKSRSYVANLLRLRFLPEEVQVFVRDGKLSAGHARLLVGRPDAVALANTFLQDGLSVRAAEAMLRRHDGRSDPSDQGHGDNGNKGGNANVDALTVDAANQSGQSGVFPGSSSGHRAEHTRPDNHSSPSTMPLGDVDRAAVEARLAMILGLKIDLVEKQGQGHLTLHFSDPEQLDRLINLLEKG